MSMVSALGVDGTGYSFALSTERIRLISTCTYAEYISILVVLRPVSDRGWVDPVGVTGSGHTGVAARPCGVDNVSNMFCL